jgi:hypothetical protein
MAKEFYNDLINYVASSDTDNANTLLMKELGKSLVKSKENFVEFLTSSGVAANDSMSDVELIDAFVDNLANNKTLMISAAYMINKQNSFSNADGEEQISDNGVKLSYKVMYDFFNESGIDGDDFRNADGEEEKSNFIPVGLLLKGAKMAKDFIQKRKEGGSNKGGGGGSQSDKAQIAKDAMKKAVADQKKAQALLKQKELEAKQKTKKILLITGGSLLGLALLGFIIYKIKKR